MTPLLPAMKSPAALAAASAGMTPPAAAPDDLLTLAFRGVVAAGFAPRGMELEALRRLYRRYLPELPVPTEAAPDAADEFGELLDLLLEHRRDDGEETRWLACAMVSACFGNDHLWQDMGLPSRAVLSDLIRIWFPRLFDKNAGNMKWKKFFYKQLCDRMEVQVCKAPSCAVCTDYSLCFGPEE